MVKKNNIDSVSQEAESIKRERVGILIKSFSNIKNYGPHQLLKCITNWSQGQIIRDECLIDELLALNAPMEVYYRDVHGTGKD